MDCLTACSIVVIFILSTMFININYWKHNVRVKKLINVMFGRHLNFLVTDSFTQYFWK